MYKRRKFLSDLSKAAAFTFIPAPTRSLFVSAGGAAELKITNVEIVRVTGPWTSNPGMNHQPQIRGADIYPELRTKAPYRDTPGLPDRTSNISHNYLQITTAGGIQGLYGALDDDVTAPILQQLAPFILGKNALQVEMIWDQMYRSNRHSRAGQFMMGMSAVDNALWDVKGKYFKTPVYELLGGATRKEIQVYGSCLSFSVEEGKAGPRAKQLFEDGFVHQKWFMAYGPGDGAPGLNHSIGLVEELRSALGADAPLMFDAFMGWDLPFATQWCRESEKFNPYWIEEPFPVDHLESFKQLRRNTNIPIATGEHFYSRWEAVNFLEEGILQVVQADPEWCGGVSELVKICNLASAYGVKVFPHGHNIHAALHVVASQSPEVCPLVEYLINHMPNKVHFQKEPLLTKNGKLPLPTKPGFGIELDDKKITSTKVLAAGK